MKTALAVLAASGLLSSAGCGATRPGASSSPAASAGSSSASDAVAAELQGVKVTVAELDEKLKGPLRQLGQQQYDLRRQMLQQVLTEMLLKREAAARGVSVEELVRTEVEQRVPAPTPAEIETLYGRVRGQVNGQPLQAVQSQLVDYLQKQGRDRRSAEFRRELEKKHAAKVLLAPPRFEVSVAADAPSMGPKEAPITIVEYTDYQCPYCQRAQETLETMLQRYGPKLRLVHRDFPLDMHPHARPAAAAAHCAGDQGRFWEYRRSLLLQAGDLGRQDLQARAAGLKLDAAAFGSCMASQRHLDAIEKSFVEGQALGVNGTPAFFINGRFVNGAPTVEAFAEVIEDELARSPKS